MNAMRDVPDDREDDAHAADEIEQDEDLVPEVVVLLAELALLHDHHGDIVDHLNRRDHITTRQRERVHRHCNDHEEWKMIRKGEIEMVR